MQRSLLADINLWLPTGRSSKTEPRLRTYYLLIRIYAFFSSYAPLPTPSSPSSSLRVSPHLTPCRLLFDSTWSYFDPCPFYPFLPFYPPVYSSVEGKLTLWRAGTRCFRSMIMRFDFCSLPIAYARGRDSLQLDFCARLAGSLVIDFKSSQH